MSSSLVNQVVKGYELQEVLGEGGFGAVYRAYQPLVKREVAIKVILPTYANTPEFVRRFETEAQIIAQLEHPYIVPLYDFWRDPSGAYLVMRMLRGGSLEEALKRGAWDTEAAARLLDQVAAALSVAHQSNMIHGDIKPANILLDREGNGYLSDFGLASSVKSGDSSESDVAGTPAYAAPEQIRRTPLGPYTDIYSLGLLLYEVLTGRQPFEANNVSGYVIAQLTQPTPSVREYLPDLSPAVDEVIQRATAKEPEDRYLDVISFARAFRQALADKQTANSSSVTIDLEDSFDDLISVDNNIGQIVLTADAIDLEALEVELVNPYKGLRAFQQGDAKDFFGREALTEGLLDRMRDTEGSYRFLAVVGPSGSGKSSVVKAGLIPALRRGAVPGSDHYYIVEMVPSNEVLRELEGALLSIATAPPENMSERLRTDPEALHEIIKEILPDDGSELLLLIDQFEEIYTLTADNSLRMHFMDSLRHAVTAPDSRLRVIITIRADFYDKPLLYPEFGTLIRERTEVVLPLNKVELESAIVGPAERVGVRVEEQLVTLIISDVREEPGALPLLQYALTECFERRTGYVMTLESYQESGGVLGSLARRAEELYNTMNAEQQESIRQLFLRLVTLGEGTEDTRRRILWSELVFTRDIDDPLQQVLDTYGKYRLLTFDTDPQTREPTVEVAHEALIRQWKRLRTWLQNSREDLRTQRRLNTSVTEWRNSGKDPSFLASGVRLQQFEALVENSDLVLTGEEIDYINASIEKREAARREEEARKERELALERRAARIFRALVVIFALAAVVAGGLAVVAVQQQQEAERQRAEAEFQRQEADTQRAEAVTQRDRAESERQRAERETDETLSLSFAQQARQNPRDGDTPFAGLALAMEANRISSPPADSQVTLANLAFSPGAVRMFDAGNLSFKTAFTPDGTQLLVANAGGAVSLWDVATGDLVRRFGENDNPQSGDLIFTLAISPDGTTAITGSQTKSFVLWDMATGEVIRTLDPNRREHLDAIWSVAYTADGTQALVSSNDAANNHNLILWDLETGEVVRRFEGQEAAIYDVTFSPDYSQFVTTSADSTIDLWDFNSGEIIRTLEGHTKEVYGAVFTPDGSKLISAGGDNQIIIWDLATGEAIQNITDIPATIRGIDISPNGDTFATAQFDSTVMLWNAQTGAAIDTFLGHGAAVAGIAYAPSGNTFASSGVDGIIVWDVYGRGAQIRRMSAGDALETVALNPDGTQALSGSANGELQLWNVADGTTIRTLASEQPLGEVFSVAYSPDGTTALTGSRDGSVILWNAETGDEIRRFAGHTAPVRAVAFSPDGTEVIAGGGNVEVGSGRALDNTIILWNAGTGEEIRRFEGHQAPARALDFSPDGKQIVSGSDDITLIIWDAETGEVVHTLGADDPATASIEGHADSVLAVAFSPDGTQILSGSRDNRVLLWDAETGEIVRPLLGHDGDVHQVAFSPEGTMALSAAGNIQSAGAAVDNTVLLWDLAQGEVVRRFEGHSAPVRDVVFAPDGKSALSASDDGTLILWRVDTLGELMDWIYSRYQVQCVEGAQAYNELPTPNDRCQSVAQDQGTTAVQSSVPLQTAAPTTDEPVCLVDTPADFALSTDSVDTADFQQRGPYTIGYSEANSADPLSAYIAAWAHEEADQHDNIETFDLHDAGGSFDQQVTDINAMVEAGVNLIIIDPLEQVDMSPLTDALAAASAANIPVVVVNHRVKSDAVVAFVGANDFQVGCIMAQELVAAMDGEGNHFRLNGIDAAFSDDARKQGAGAVFPLFPAITLANEGPTGLTVEGAQAFTQGVLGEHPNINGIWAYNGLLAATAEQTLAENGRAYVPVVGDNNVELARIMQENGLLGAQVRVSTNATGTQAVQTALSILAGESVPTWVQIPIEVIPSSALSQYDLDAERGLLGEAEGLPEQYQPAF